MGPWLRIGNRLEYTLGVLALVFFLGTGFTFAGRAPSEIRWMVWSYVAGFTFPLGAAALLVGRWRRRMLGGPQTASAKLPAPVHRNSRRVS